jgi:uncharacterized protein with GYD domain
LPTYIVLYKFTDEGRRSIKDTVRRSAQIEAENRRRGFRLVGSWWTQGQYDLVAVLNAPSEAAMMGGLYNIAESGNVSSETLRAFSVSEVRRSLRIARGTARPAAKKSARRRRPAAKKTARRRRRAAAPARPARRRRAAARKRPARKVARKAARKVARKTTRRRARPAARKTARKATRRRARPAARKRPARKAARRVTRKTARRPRRRAAARRRR